METPSGFVSRISVELGVNVNIALMSKVTSQEPAVYGFVVPTVDGWKHSKEGQTAGIGGLRARIAWHTKGRHNRGTGPVFAMAAYYNTEPYVFWIEVPEMSSDERGKEEKRWKEHFLSVDRARKAILAVRDKLSQCATEEFDVEGYERGRFDAFLEAEYDEDDNIGKFIIKYRQLFRKTGMTPKPWFSEEGEAV